MPIDYEKARRYLEEALRQVESDLLQGVSPAVEEKFSAACETIFTSKTQAYREVLLGCILARIQDKSIDIRKPYVQQGERAFSGRTLDEKVVNPFLHEKGIPSSRGPYLSVFRRSVEFVPRPGLKDKPGYDALLLFIGHLESISDDAQLRHLLRYVLFKFCQLRDAAVIPVSRLQRISLDQYDMLISRLLDIPSGGRFPVLVVVATFTSIKEHFALDWNIGWQGINVADTASGAGADITITSGGQTLLAAEVTERLVERSRVIATFTTKIAPAGIEDYLFLVKSLPSPETKQQAHLYFAQGHEVNFLEIKTWVLMVLATVGKSGRQTFNQTLLKLVESGEVPASLKVKWNEEIARLIEMPQSA